MGAAVRKLPMKKITGPSWPKRDEVEEFKAEQGSCAFCTLQGNPPSRVVHQGEKVRVINVNFPYYPEHVMITPVKHVKNFRNLNEETFSEIISTLQKIHVKNGFAYLNDGFVAGQTRRCNSRDTREKL